jgi:hypothetical protein
VISSFTLPFVASDLLYSILILYHVNSLPADQLHATETLAALMDIINQTVGDAISDMLIVETVLHARGWSIQDWEAAYTDLPNRQLKVVVKVGGKELFYSIHLLKGTVNNVTFFFTSVTYVMITSNYWVQCRIMFICLLLNPFSWSLQFFLWCL